MSASDIINLQQQIDIWYERWISVTGREGMTNYIHMLGAGHVTYYLHKKKNLYRYSNQAWERFNKHVKRCYLTKTQRGGHGKYAGDATTNTLKCPHTVPLARWLQRVIMWNTGYGDDYFKSKEMDE
jgi:hypothetical protein